VRGSCRVAYVLLYRTPRQRRTTWPRSRAHSLAVCFGNRLLMPRSRRPQRSSRPCFAPAGTLATSSGTRSSMTGGGRKSCQAPSTKGTNSRPELRAQSGMSRRNVPGPYPSAEALPSHPRRARLREAADQIPRHAQCRVWQATARRAAVACVSERAQSGMTGRISARYRRHSVVGEPSSSAWPTVPRIGVWGGPGCLGPAQP